MMTHSLKSLALSVIVLVLLASQLRPAGQSPADFQLAAGRAGRLEVGMPVDDIYRVVGRENTRLFDAYREGMFEPALEVRLRGSVIQPALVIPVREWPCIAWSAQGLEVRDPRFRTAEGVGVGSTLAEVSKAYVVTVSNEEGPHAWAESMHMGFGLDDASLAPTVKVKSVWLPGDPVAIRKARCPERGALGQ